MILGHLLDQLLMDEKTPMVLDRLFVTLFNKPHD